MISECILSALLGRERSHSRSLFTASSPRYEGLTQDFGVRECDGTGLGAPNNTGASEIYPLRSTHTIDLGKPVRGPHCYRKDVTGTLGFHQGETIASLHDLGGLINRANRHRYSLRDSLTSSVPLECHFFLSTFGVPMLGSVSSGRRSGCS